MGHLDCAFPDNSNEFTYNDYEILKFNVNHINSILKSYEEKLVPSREPEIDFIHELANVYESKKLVLVLGSGVSNNCGLPDWKTLLQKLLLKTEFESCEPENQSRVTAEIFSKTFDSSPLISARYILKHYPQNDMSEDFPFENFIRENLYKGYQLKLENKLFNEILNFCVGDYKGSRIDSIITYNFDDLMESFLKNQNIELEYESIYADGMRPSAHKMPIFHVHGFLPREGPLSNSNKIVFSEDMYHQQYHDMYSWNNIIQINKFTDYTCLFMGVSLTDPNLRRLLDTSMKLKGSSNEKLHYMIRRKTNNDEIEKKLKALLEKDDNLYNMKLESNITLGEVVERLIKIQEKFLEDDALSLGLRTIWIDEFDKMPIILEKIRRNYNREEPNRKAPRKTNSRVKKGQKSIQKRRGQPGARLKT